MKRAIVLVVITTLSQAIAAFAGPEVSSKAVVAPPPPPPPPEFFRPNEFDIGAFATYITGVGSGDAGKLHAWGGGMDFSYWFPWKYAGVRFQGTGVSIRGGGGSRTKEVTVVPGFPLAGKIADALKNATRRITNAVSVRRDPEAAASVADFS